MFIKILLLIVFFALMIGVGFYSRRHAGNGDDYVLGGRTVGPWITAFAFGTSYFSSVVFMDRPRCFSAARATAAFEGGMEAEKMNGLELCFT